MNDSRWIVLVENLEQLGPSVGLKRVPRVFGQTERVARPSCPGDLDHHMRSPVMIRSAHHGEGAKVRLYVNTADVVHDLGELAAEAATLEAEERIAT